MTGIWLPLAATALALAARRRLRRPQGVPQRPARAETGMLAVVLALSAILTVLPVPADADRPLPFAPPADGPTVPVGTRAGEIGISARASAGQLVVDLATPRTGDSTGPSYEFTATLADPRGTTRALKLRGCGTGCFYAPVSWRDGTSRLTLTAAAGQWHGGRAGLTVTWPPRPDAGLLREAVAAMKATPRFTLHELVTSNTARDLGNQTELPLTGAPLPRLRAVRQRHRLRHHPPARRGRTPPPCPRLPRRAHPARTHPRRARPHPARDHRGPLPPRHPHLRLPRTRRGDQP